MTDRTTPDPTQDSFEYTSEYAKMSHNPTEKDIQYVTVGDRKFISEEAHHQAVTEAVREALERIIGPGPRPTGINAIPQTDDYANGWNDCRKEAHNQLQNYRAEMLAKLSPTTEGKE